MRIFIIFLATIFVILGHVSARVDCKLKLAQCETKKRTIPRKPVCGSDNQTYPYKCALLKKRCAHNSSLTMKHKGKCKDKKPCWIDRNEKLNTNHSTRDQQNINSEYVPECLTDGTYAPVQCHTSMGYCWCVTAHGRMIPRTTARHQKLECPKRGRTSTSFKNSTDGTLDFSKKGCDQTVKNIFVNNLVRIFKTEYNRDASDKEYYFHANESTSLENNAIQWKFVTLDKDRNKSLAKNEYRDLRKLIKKVVKPRRCSRAFIRLCDIDQDSIISQNEWTRCLNIDNTGSSKDVEETVTRKSIVEDSLAETTDHLSMSESQVDLSGAEFVGKASASFPLTDHSSANEKESEEKANDCTSDRRAVLEELNLRNQEVYVPECTSRGFYKKVQCYPSTGYCWCVLEDSGKPIPGTSVRNSDPKCDSVPQLPRSIKGCPDHQKILFIKDLMTFFERNLTSNAELSKENQKKLDQLVSLSFHSLDGNKNDFLDRREWKLFRAMMATSKSMKRCGRKFPRYCDSNRDFKITRTEWVQCLNLETVSSPVGTHSNTASTKRRGPNPIESYLKDDD